VDGSGRAIVSTPAAGPSNDDVATVALPAAAVHPTASANTEPRAMIIGRIAEACQE
jgi:hypothetical protein